MNDKDIQLLLNAFYDGGATEEEERLLKEFFSSDNLPEHWIYEQKIFNALLDTSGIPVPDNLEDRLEAKIDEHIEQAKRFSIRRVFYWTASVAAIGLLCIGLFIKEGHTPGSFSPQIADTYQNPEEAAIAAQRALMLMSANINKGIAQLDNAKQEVKNVNRILNNQLK